MSAAGDGDQHVEGTGHENAIRQMASLVPLLMALEPAQRLSMLADWDNGTLAMLCTALAAEQRDGTQAMLLLSLALVLAGGTDGFPLEPADRQAAAELVALVEHDPAGDHAGAATALPPAAAAALALLAIHQVRSPSVPLPEAAIRAAASPLETRLRVMEELLVRPDASRDRAMARPLLHACVLRIPAALAGGAGLAGIWCVLAPVSHWTTLLPALGPTLVVWATYAWARSSIRPLPDKVPALPAALTAVGLTAAAAAVPLTLLTLVHASPAYFTTIGSAGVLTLVFLIPALTYAQPLRPHLRA